MSTAGYKNKIPRIRSALPLFSNFINLGFIQVSNAVIQILLFPLIIHIVGLEKFGIVMVANSFATLAALVINYGTSVSGVKDVSLHKEHALELSRVVYSIFFTRLLLSLLYLVSLPVLYFSQYDIAYFLLTAPILLAEIVNPLFFFTGIEKLFIYNLANLLSKLVAALLIIFLIKTPENAPWVNFYLGIGNLFFYLLLSIYTIKRFRLGSVRPYLPSLLILFKQNFYLAGNAISVHLQQSLFLFSIASLHNPVLLGAYSLCDKIVWSFRLLLTAFSGAVFPKAVRIYRESAFYWNSYKRKTNQYLACFFLLVAVVLLISASFIPKILTGTNDAVASSFIRAISFVPFVAAMNVLNVLDLIIKDRYIDIFKIAVTLLCITVLLSLLFVRFGSVYSFGYYPVIIEACAIPLYLYFIKRESLKSNMHA